MRHPLRTRAISGGLELMAQRLAPIDQHSLPRDVVDFVPDGLTASRVNIAQPINSGGADSGNAHGLNRLQQCELHMGSHFVSSFESRSEAEASSGHRYGFSIWEGSRSVSTALSIARRRANAARMARAYSPRPPPAERVPHSRPFAVVPSGGRKSLVCGMRSDQTKALCVNRYVYRYHAK
jgi:hypothetical protein